MTSNFTPSYRHALPLTLPRLEEAIEDLQATTAYAIKHEDVLVLDELFCQVLALEHWVMAWDKNLGETPYIRESLALIERALKWAWFACDEEKSIHGLYADKLQAVIAALVDFQIVLVSREQVVTAQQSEGEGDQEPGMTEDEAEALAQHIKTQLPLDEVDVTSSGSRTWAVVARNPQRGTSQLFRQPKEFDALMRRSAR